MIESIKKIDCGKFKENVPLKNLTSYRLAGIAKYVVYPETVEQLIKILEFSKQNNIKHIVIGNGSNIIFPCDYDGIIIKTDSFDSYSRNDTVIKVGAGFNLMKLAYKTVRDSLSGLEFASGIPGSVGGAVYMNAGAYNSDMGYLVSDVLVLTPDYQLKTLYNKELDFHYRTSFFQKNKGYIILEATIVLKNGNKDLMLEIIEDRKKRRFMSQPLEFPSAGSVFKNPDNDSAWRLVEYIGYKGKKIGDAEVSMKHANFIINRGEARGSDIIKLINQIKEEVQKEFGIELKVEQEIVE